MKLIGSITVTPKKPKVGESVCIEVKSPDGKSYEKSQKFLVIINGVPGAKQYLQFDQAGKNLLFVVVHKKGVNYEYQRFKLEILENPNQLPIIKVHQRLDKPLHLDFAMSWGSLLSRVHAQALARKKDKKLTTSVAKKNITVEKPQFTAKLVNKPRYLFDFGNGTKSRSWKPICGHDFTDSLDPNKETQSFHVSVDYTDPENGKVTTLRRTICIVNPYFMAKKRGYIQPPVKSTNRAITVTPEDPFEPRSARRTRVHIQADLSVKNLEDEHITLINYRLEPIFSDPDQLTTVLSKHSTNIQIGPRQQLQLSEKISLNDLPKDAVGFGLHYTGQTKSGKPVTVTSYFDIPEKMKHKIHFTPEFREKFKMQIGKLQKKGGQPPDKDIPLAKMDVKEGDYCDPYNLPDEMPEGLMCQPVLETYIDHIPGRFLNARKGDIILSPGSSSGFVAQILRSLEPSQYHSHSGIMTKNHTQITHSTASEEWLTDDDKDRVGLDGFVPDNLRYMWPGVVTQSIEGAVNGDNYEYPDDEEKKSYLITGFYPYHYDVGSLIVNPLVIKPHPQYETETHRKKLSEIASYALEQTGKSHYRLYCYTRPAMALANEGIAPDSAGWAAGTYPTICSSFVWYCVTKKCGIFKMEDGELEPDDTKEGEESEISPECPDGLYIYRAHERLLAGETIFSKIRQKVMNSLSHADSITQAIADIDDMADDCANQITNTFATDWAETESKDSEDWKNATDCFAVSPDNILWWDRPLKGLYGYSETLLYSAPHEEEVHYYKWRSITGFGTLKGRVEFQNQSVDKARIEILSYPDLAAYSEPNGEFVIPNVPEGYCEITAIKTNDPDVPWKTPKPIMVQIERDKEHYEIITLKGPNPANRLADLGITVVVKYLPPWGAAAGSPSGENIEEVFLAVRPEQTSPEAVVSHIVADARGEARVTVTGNVDRSITVNMRARVYNGWEEGDDWEESETHSFNVPADGIREGWIHLIWKNEVWIYINAYNEVDPAG